MKKRIIKFEEGGNNEYKPPQPAQEPQPIQMEDLLNSAERDWKSGNKTKAFVTVLGAMSMISQGAARAMKAAESVEEILKRQDFKSPNGDLKNEPPTTPTTPP